MFELTVVANTEVVGLLLMDFQMQVLVPKEEEKISLNQENMVNGSDTTSIPIVEKRCMQRSHIGRHLLFKLVSRISPHSNHSIISLTQTSVNSNLILIPQEDSSWRDYTVQT